MLLAGMRISSQYSFVWGSRHEAVGIWINVIGKATIVMYIPCTSYQYFLPSLFIPCGIRDARRGYTSDATISGNPADTFLAELRRTCYKSTASYGKYFHMVG